MSEAAENKLLQLLKNKKIDNIENNVDSLSEDNSLLSLLRKKKVKIL